jgi:hypothetical protein
MSKPQPLDNLIELEEDEDEHIAELSENDLYRLLMGCGFLVVPVIPEDERQNAPTSEKFH